jgi:all-trans-8'-apo-beta-carotenal 15,15'-oxygenase
MATTNLFWGQGPSDHQLAVTSGDWPTDMEGSVFIVGPDKRTPGGHWFDAQGLLCRIDLSPTDGKVAVRHRRVTTPLAKLRSRLPFLFAKLNFMELSPFGLSNLANTNVAAINGRLFIGYDAGRPVEVDPDTMEVLTAVGGYDEWYVAVPGLYEPGLSIAAHPAVDEDTEEMFFVNYSPLPHEGGMSIGRWLLDGPLIRREIDTDVPFASIHDIKLSRDFLVIADLPFTVEPGTFRGKQPTAPNQDVTNLWIIRRSDLLEESAAPVPAQHVQIPIPTGHISVEYDNPDGRVTVFCEQVPIADLMVRIRKGDRSHITGREVDSAYDGFITHATNPGGISRHCIDTTKGIVESSDVVWDRRFWGALLAAKDETTPEARASAGSLWYSGSGYSPNLITETWWNLYGNADLTAWVQPEDLPTEEQPGSVARFNRQDMTLEELYVCPPGVFLHPPTFVPRTTHAHTDDGYLVTIAHQNGAKAIWVFDALAIAAGPIAIAESPAFNPSLLLHSCWMPPQRPKRPGYHISVREDVKSAVRASAKAAARLARSGDAIRKAW